MVVGLASSAGFAADPVAPPGGEPPDDGSERVVALNEQGSALYAAGDYRRAAERFLQAYAVDEDPNLLFNIGSCYEALGDIDAALEKYRAFLAAPHADPEGRPRAERAVARLTAIEETPAAEPPLPAPAQPSPPPVVPADGGAPSAGWVPWASLTGGVVLGAIGTTFYLMGAADHAEVTGVPGFGEPNSVAGITRRRANDLVESGDTKKAIGLASASVGAALIASSIVWWLVDPVRAPSEHSGLDVTWTTSHRSVLFNGTF